MLYGNIRGGKRLMTYLDLVLSGLFQGLTTVLPIEAHAFTHPPSPDPAVASVLTAAFASGSVVAILIMLFPDVALLGRGFLRAIKRRSDQSSRLLGMVLLASAPTLIVDIWFTAYIPQWTALVSALLVIGIGLLLGAADHLGVTIRDMDHLTVTHYSVIGVIKAALSFVGLAPQDSVIILSRLFGCERDQAARLSLLLMIIPLSTHAVLAAHAAAASPVHAPVLDMSIAGVCSFLASAFGVSAMLAYLKRRSFMPFAVAHLLVGGWILRGLF